MAKQFLSYLEVFIIESDSLRGRVVRSLPQGETLLGQEASVHTLAFLALRWLARGTADLVGAGRRPPLASGGSARLPEPQGGLWK